MGKVQKNSTGLLCAAAAALYFLLIFILIPFTYGINDDMTLRDIASGAVSGTPDGHLIYVQYVLGKLISLLYMAVQGIDWYALVWLGLMLFCFGLLLYRTAALCRCIKRSLLAGLFGALVLFTLVYLDYFVNFQYTIVASITGGTAVFFYFTMDPEKPLYVRLREYAVIALLAWITYCIRSQVFMLAVPFGAVLFLGKKKIRIAEKAMFLAAVLAGIFVVFIIERGAYSSQEWKDFRNFNQARTEIYDYYGVPPYSENEAFYESIGMEECDVVNLERYRLYFTDGLETGKLEETAEYAEKLWKETQTPIQRVKNGIKLAAKGFGAESNLLVNIAAKLFLAAVLIRGWKRRRKDFWMGGSLLLIEGALWLYLGCEGRLPDRVGAALLITEFSCALALLFHGCMDEGKEVSLVKSRVLAAGFFVLAAAVCGLHIASVREERMSAARRNEEFERFNAYFAEHSENVYFYPVDFSGDYTENLRIFRSFEVSNGFPLGGWLTFSPLREAGLGKYGIQEVDKALIEKDNIYLVMTSASSRIDEHYLQKDIEIKWEQTDQAPVFQTEVPVWKLSAEGETNDDIF